MSSPCPADRFLDRELSWLEFDREQAFGKRLDIPATILRPAYFMQNERMVQQVIQGYGVYPMPIGSAASRPTRVPSSAGTVTDAPTASTTPWRRPPGPSSTRWTTRSERPFARAVRT